MNQVQPMKSRLQEIVNHSTLSAFSIPAGYLADGGAWIERIELRVEPAVEGHGRAACKHHAEHHQDEGLPPGFGIGLFDEMLETSIPAPVRSSQRASQKWYARILRARDIFLRLSSFYNSFSRSRTSSHEYNSCGHRNIERMFHAQLGYFDAAITGFQHFGIHA